MAYPIQEKIPELLERNIPRDLVLSFEEAMQVGAQRAFAAAKGMHNGHFASVLGQLRHFHMNESFYLALSENGASPSLPCGNRIVTGRSGIFTIARLNVKHDSKWGSRFGKTRHQMSLENAGIDQLVQPQLFVDNEYASPSKAVVFIVAIFAKNLKDRAETPVSIEVAVPDRKMESWPFHEPIDLFIQRYDHVQEVTQEDMATPKLKKDIGKRDKDGVQS